MLTAEPAGPPRLLVVEDHEEGCEYLRQLVAADYQVTTAKGGVAGWDAALAQLPDLIISDVMMLRSDGLKLCQHLKQHPKTSHIPLLLLTARTAEAQQMAGLGLGADDYVSKPFTPAVLQARVEALLRNCREKAIRVVEDRLGSPALSVQVLVREMAMSQLASYRRLGSLTGQTAVEFIRDVRLERAVQLLTSPR